MTLYRTTLTFLDPHPTREFAEPQTLRVTERIREGYRAVWPTGGCLEKDRLILTSSDGKHTTIIRGGDMKKYEWYTEKGYILVNGEIPI